VPLEADPSQGSVLTKLAFAAACIAFPIIWGLVVDTCMAYLRSRRQGPGPGADAVPAPGPQPTTQDPGQDPASPDESPPTRP
jgi:hypothetical protein